MRAKAGWLTAVLAAVCVKALGASGLVADFRYATALRLPASGREELAAVVLTPAAYLETQSGLSDIRVVRMEDGECVPCLVEQVTEEREERVRKPVSLSLVRAEELEGRRLCVVLEREAQGHAAAEPVCGVVIHTPLRDFERRVSVDASSDGALWQAVVKDARIFDLSGHADFRLNEVGLPAVTQRFLRVTVDRMDEVRTGAASTVTSFADAAGKVQAVERQIREELRPFRMDRVEGWAEQVRWTRDALPLTNRAVRVVAGEPGELRSRFRDARLICIEAGRVPLVRLLTRSAKSILSLSYLLFERVDPVVPGSPEWRQIAAGEVARIVFRDFAQERMEIGFAESRAHAYCLVLADGAGAADLEVTGGMGPSHRVVFPYGAGESFSLLAVADGVTGPAGYRPEQIRLLLRKGYSPVAAHLEGWSENPAWRRKGGRFFSAEAAWLLPVAVAVLVLGCAVAIALRRLPMPAE